MIKVSEFLSNDTDPFVLGSFYNRSLEVEINDTKYIYCYVDFRKSAKVNDLKFDFETYLETRLIMDLNSQSWPKEWKSNRELLLLGLKLPKKSALYVIENDLNISLSSFFNKLHFKIALMDFVMEDKLTDEQKRFIRGFLENRGSVDTTTRYLTNDFFYNSVFELKRVRVLSESLNVPNSVINFNFRNLQNQFVSGVSKRNTQLRVNIHWYASEIGFLNKYKSFIYKTIYGNPVQVKIKDIEYYSDFSGRSEKDMNYQFGKYLDIYSDHVYNKDLTTVEINELREKLNFNNGSVKLNRDRSIIELFRMVSEDRCSSCGTTETSLNKKTNRQNFDIHHYIPFSNNKSKLDTMDNLVKLCPNCHDALKRNRSSVSTQINICKNILESSNIILEFAGAYFDIDDIDLIAERTQKLLL